MHQLYQVVRYKQASYALNGLSFITAHMSESHAVSQCLHLLESVVKVRGNLNAHESAKELRQPNAALDNLYDSSKQTTSGPQRSDENLEAWGGQVAHAMLESAGATIYFIPWIRALLLAMSSYSVIETVHNYVEIITLIKGSLYSTGGRCIDRYLLSEIV